MKPRTKKQARGRQTSSKGYTRVDSLPSLPSLGKSFWIESPNGHPDYTHRLIRFPAKFHPPIVRWALNSFGRRQGVVLDPFTGSGTVQVEALVSGISSVGIDIDPLACFVARAKTRPIDPRRLEEAKRQLVSVLERFRRGRSELASTAGGDMSEAQYERESRHLPIPPIPNAFHWFRRYVIIDLARILWAIEETVHGRAEAHYFRACLAAIVRRVSNADPEPVSGLEVTSLQATKNRTRQIDVFGVYLEKVTQAQEGMTQLCNALGHDGKRPTATVIKGDALNVEDLLSETPLAQTGYPLVITSPPYCRAVEYSRRHQLELYWLGFVSNQTQHIDLTHTYIGRKLVRESDWNGKPDFGLKALDNKIRQIASRDVHKGRTVSHYFHSMHEVFGRLSKIMSEHGVLICVVGNSTCCGIPIPTADFISELASDTFQLKNRFAYALQNHSMHYGLWNGDGIKKEHVLVLRAR